MKAIYDEVSLGLSKRMTRRYSTSFSLGILFLDRSIRTPIYNIYGFVRLADEIVDSFHGYDQEKLLSKLKADTIEAIEMGISTNPVLHSFQEVVRQYQIDWDLIDTFLQSMEMDLDQSKYDMKSYEKYILGSAEVVGLMCLKVFTNGDEQLYRKLRPTAKKLGSAFQKVNFLRDAQSDFKELGRTYFPGVNLNQFTEENKKEIEKEIEEEFALALEGIKQLPSSSRKGVYLAYFYYYRLFKKIKRLSPQNVLKTRTRIPNGQKLVLMFQSLVRHELNMM